MYSYSLEKRLSYLLELNNESAIVALETFIETDPSSIHEWVKALETLADLFGYIKTGKGGKMRKAI